MREKTSAVEAIVMFLMVLLFTPLGWIGMMIVGLIVSIAIHGPRP